MSEQAQGQPAPETTEGQEAVEVSVRPDDPSSEPAPEVEVSSKIEAKYTDKDVDKLKGQARKEARERTEREILERYGIDSFDSLGSIVEEHKTVQEATATETEKERKAREKAETELAKRQQELDGAYARIAQMTEDSALRNALTEAGAKPGQVATLLRLADRDALDVDDNGNLTGVEEQVQALKDSIPELFAADRPAGVGSTGARDERPMNVWDMPKEEFEALQHKVMSGQRVAPPEDVTGGR